MLIFLCTRLVWADVSEYQLLWEDLANGMTYGYKSHFDMIELIGKPNPSQSPQALIIKTDISHHFAIMGPGFFKIIVDDTTVGYTRNGEFNARLDLEAETWELVTQRGYALADPIFLYTTVIERDNQGREKALGIVKGNSRKQWEDVIARMAGNDSIVLSELHGPKIAKQLKVYAVPYEKLRYFREGIYVLEPGYTAEIVESPDSRVINSTLELSNVSVLEVLTRMYYLTVTDATIKDRLFKAELLKIGIEKYAQANDMVEQAIIILHNNFQEFMDKKVNQKSSPPLLPSSVYERNMKEALQGYQNSRYFYIQGILPFIRYDY